MNISTDAPAGAGAARLAIVCFAAFALGIALMHVLRPDYAPASHMISDYAVGPWGGVMTAAFGSASAGCLLLAICMAQSGPRSAWAWLITVLFTVTATGLLVTAIFPTDIEGGPSTRSGDIHDISFLVNITSIVAAAISALVLTWRDSRWFRYRKLGTVFVSLLLFALVVQFMTFHRGMPYGLANRFFVLVLISWLISMALTISRLRPRS
jgi:hypothetical protein